VLIAEVERGTTQLKQEIREWNPGKKRENAANTGEGFVLDVLAEDPNPIVGSLICCNPATRGDILSRAAEEGNDYIKMLVAHNPSTPLEVLDRLSNSPNMEILAAIVINPNTSEVTRFRVKGKLGIWE
jgi:hypothetical protein